MSNAALIACHDCDYLHVKPLLKPNEKAYCSRCGAHLMAHQRQKLTVEYALTITGFMVLILAIMFPIATVIIKGQTLTATLFTIIQTLNLQQYPILAFLVLFTLGLAPALELGAIGFILWQLHLKNHIKNDRHVNHANLALATKLRANIKPWVLVDVFMLGVLVALVKLKAIVIIELGVGLWAFTALMIILYYLSDTLNISHDEA